jgi:hypothetical protein
MDRGLFIKEPFFCILVREGAGKELSRLKPLEQKAPKSVVKHFLIYAHRLTITIKKNILSGRMKEKLTALRAPKLEKVDFSSTGNRLGCLLAESSGWTV